MIVAAIDCGTNTINVLIVDKISGRELDRRSTIVRLGEGVDKTGEFNPEAIARVKAALEEFVSLMKQNNVAKIRMVATSASRDVSNREGFFQMVAELLGEVVPGTQAEVISGVEEANLTFMGAVSGVDVELGETVVVSDVGGGSTEITVGIKTGEKFEVISCESVDVGCIRLAERYPNPLEAKDWVQEKLASALDQPGMKAADKWVAVAGTATTLAGIFLELPAYLPREIHLTELSFEQLDTVCDWVLKASQQDLESNPVIRVGRVDVLPAGAVITNHIAHSLAGSTKIGSMIASETNILDGIVELL